MLGANLYKVSSTGIRLLHPLATLARLTFHLFYLLVMKYKNSTIRSYEVFDFISGKQHISGTIYHTLTGKVTLLEYFFSCKQVGFLHKSTWLTSY